MSTRDAPSGDGLGRVVVATRNPGKLSELVAMFAEVGLAPVDLRTLGVEERVEEESLEAFETFEENALAKARYFHARTALPTVADDSGLVVDALGGAPGVRSKRFSGAVGVTGAALDAANNARLLELLSGVTDRTAHFACAVAFVDGSTELVRTGEVPGEMLESPRGTAGFGYDPLFHSRELGMTFAEAGREAKARVSHRGRAFRALVAALAVSGGTDGEPGR